MLSICIIIVAACLIVVIAFTYKGTSQRAKHMRFAAITMLVAAVLRELGPLIGEPPALDLYKRAVFLGTEMCAIVLVLTFKRKPPTAATIHKLWTTAVAVGIIEFVLIAPRIYHCTAFNSYYEVHTIEAVAYYGIYEATLLLTALVVGIGCFSALLRRHQPIVAQLTLVFIGVAAITTIGYVGVGVMSLLHYSIANQALIRQQLFLTTIVLLLAGLAIGSIRKIAFNSHRAIAVSTAIKIVEPLWCTATSLQPDVVLQCPGLSNKERLIRLVVETHDALSLIRRDPDPALNIVRLAYPDDPYLTAALLLHLLGERAMPPIPRRRAAMLMRIAHLMPDQILMTSIRDLYVIRRACASRDQWWTPAQIICD